MICENCIHYNACKGTYMNVSEYKSITDFDGEHYADIYHCNDFADKSEWVHLPCKVGDTIYFDTYRHGESIGVQPHNVGEVVVIVSTTRKFGCVGADIPDWEFGKTVFLTREEAEKALEDMRKDLNGGKIND